MNQIFTGPNALPSSTPQALQHCNLHGHGADSVAAPAFRFSGQRIDWRTLHGVDFDTLASEGDVGSWQRCLEAGLLDGNLSAEPAGKLTLNNVLQFSKLAQFGLQLLNQSLQEGGDTQALKAENKRLRAEAAVNAKVITKVKAEHKRMRDRQAEIQAENKRAQEDNERAKQVIELLNEEAERRAQQQQQQQQQQPPPRETTLLTSMDRNTASWQRHHDQDSEPMQALQQLQASINAGQHDHTIKDLQQMHAQHQAQMREREGRFAELQEELSVVAAAKRKAEELAAQRQRDLDAANRHEKEAARALSKRIAHLETQCKAHQARIDELIANQAVCNRDQHAQQIRQLTEDKAKLDAELDAALRQAQEDARDKQTWLRREQHLLDLLKHGEEELNDARTWQARALRAEKKLQSMEEEHEQDLHDLRQQLKEARSELQKRMQQLQEQEAELQAMDRELQEYKNVVGQLEGVQETMEHARRDFKQFGGYLDKLQHAQRDVDNAAFKLKALSRPPSAQAPGHYWKHKRDPLHG